MTAKKHHDDSGRTAKSDTPGERYRALERSRREWHARIEKTIERARQATRR